MTVYATDFSEYTASTPLSDWTDFYATGDFTYNAETSSGDNLLGTKWLDFQTTGAAKNVLTWDDVGVVSDSDILVKVISNTDAVSNTGFKTACRVSGSGGAENQYNLEITLTTVRIVRWLNGASFTLDDISITLGSTTLDYWVRFSAVGTSMKGKIWEVTEVEPNDWTIEVTDSNLSSGRVGVGTNQTVHDQQVDYFACDTTGATVTFPPTGWIPTEFGSFNLGSEGYTDVINTLLIGGQFVDTGKILTGAKFYVAGTHTVQVRVAAYSGGSLSDPEGATLLYDFGETTGSDINTWLEFTGAYVPIPPDEPLWIGFKSEGGTFNIPWSTDPGNSGNFQKATGRYGGLHPDIDNDSSVVWPDAIPANTGSFSDVWYFVKAVIEDEPSPSTAKWRIGIGVLQIGV